MKRLSEHDNFCPLSFGLGWLWEFSIWKKVVYQFGKFAMHNIDRRKVKICGYMDHKKMTVAKGKGGYCGHSKKRQHCFMDNLFVNLQIIIIFYI